MDYLTTALRWAYPPPAEQGYLNDFSNIFLFCLPLLLHLISIRLLLRHHASPLANATRAGIILPLTILASIRAGFGAILAPVRFGPNPSRSKFAPSWLVYTMGGEQTEGGFQHFHVAVGVYGAYSIMRALEWGLMREPPRLRKELLDIYRLERKQGLHGRDDRSENGSIPPTFLPRYFPGTRIPLELDLLSNMRGIGWVWGIDFEPGHAPIVRPQAGTPEDKELRARCAKLIKERFWLALKLFLFVDAVDSLLKTKALFGVRANVGGPLALGGAATEGLRYEEQPHPALGWLLTLLAGLVIPTSMQATYSLLSALSLLHTHLFPHSDWVWNRTYADPALWAPPLFRRPQNARDLRELWSTDWHALFRGPFLAVAYRPVNEGLKALGLGAGSSSTSSAKSSSSQGPDAKVGNGNGSTVVVQKKKAAPSPLSLWRGAPGKLLRRALSVLSVFFVSGLMHEAGQLAMGRTLPERDPLRILGLGEPILVYAPPTSAGALRLAYVDRGGRALAFFVMQGVACVLEDGLESLISRRAGGRQKGLGSRGGLVGWLTWFWMVGWIFGWGHYVGKTWYRMGIAQGVVSLRLTGAVAQMAIAAFSRS
ncbi:hypothetical protein V8E36_008916 [Tilletia maclaganii]